MSTGAPGCDLRGLGVLVTRPARQAESLCELIEAHGGLALRFPVLEIQPGGTDADRRRLANANHYHRLIFVSANAVEQAAPHLPENLKPTVAAVGAATARALRDIGIRDVLIPEGRADTEGLLALSAMQRVEGRRVLIVRGEGGRAMLGDTLSERGAEVDYAEIYRRAVPGAGQTSLPADWENVLGAVTVTSGEALDNLCRRLGYGRRLLETPLIVVSERTAHHAHQAGFRSVHVSAGASDEALLVALCALAQREGNTDGGL